MIIVLCNSISFDDENSSHHWAWELPVPKQGGRSDESWHGLTLSWEHQHNVICVCISICICLCICLCLVFVMGEHSSWLWNALTLSWWYNREDKKIMMMMWLTNWLRPDNIIILRSTMTKNWWSWRWERYSNYLEGTTTSIHKGIKVIPDN